MSCNISIDTSPISSELKQRYGTNGTLITQYLTEVAESFEVDEQGNVSGIVFKQRFADSIKNRLEIDVNNLQEKDIKETVDYIEEYFNRNHPSVHATSTVQRESTPVGSFGYSSIEAREFAKRTLGSFALQGYIDIIQKAKMPIEKYLQQTNEKLKKAGKKPISKRQLFESIIKKKLTNELSNRLKAAGIEETKIAQILKDTIPNIHKAFGEHLTVQDKNVIAMWGEMRAESKTLFDEIFRDNRLGEIRIEDTHTIEEDANYDTISEQIDELENGDDSVSQQRDQTTASWNGHMGDHSTFLTHVGMSLRTYFNSLHRLHSGNVNPDGNRDVNTDNDLGIADTMDAAQCIAVFYSYGNFFNRATMIASAREIANNVPGMQAFHKFAEDLERNSDFAFEVYRTFGKTVISKIETVLNEGSISSRRSNRTADKLTAITFDFMNAIKSTSISNDDLINKEKSKRIDDLVATLKELENQISKGRNIDNNTRLFNKYKTELTAALAEHLRIYYPSIQESAIANYLSNAGDKSFAKNALNLTNIFKATISASYDTQQKYNSRRVEIGKAWKHNQELDERRRNGERIPNDAYIDMEPLYAIDYVSEGSKAAAIRLANELVKFSSIKTDLNSRNVNGNQSSDVINNSMITNILNTLKSTIALDNFGKYKFQSRQYDFSNILLEHRDANGKIINYGLFRETTPGSKNYVATEYAQRLLQVSLFNGANNRDSSNSALYSEMSQGDYVATAISNFFNVEDDFSGATGEQISMGNYFMRIPSDAPKNFVITAPIYRVGESRYGAKDGLFKIDNEVEANRTIRSRIASMTINNDEYTTLAPKASSLNQLIERATSNQTTSFAIRSIKECNEEKPKVGDTVTVTFEYKTKDGIVTQYVMQGKLTTDNGRVVVQEAKFLGFLGYEKSEDVESKLVEHFKNVMLKSGEITRSINTNHPIYQQFRQIFIQELTDASTALSKIFEMNSDKPGLVKKDPTNNLPVFKPGFDNSSNGTRRSYTGYHHAKKQPYFTVDGDGIAHLTGSVFGSDRFTIGTRNYGAELLKEAFSFLYGGANDSYIHRNADGIYLTTQQEEALQKKLTEFINDYVSSAVERVQASKEFVPAEYMTDDKIAEFALNHHIMYNSFNDLFEGDTKFYKGSQDFLKRAKEAQGSGVPYGIVNYEEALNAPMTHVESSLDRTEFNIVDANGNVIGTKKFELRNRFVGVTITNVIRTSDEVAVADPNKPGSKDGSCTKMLINALKASGMNTEDATAKARAMMSEYGKTTVDDAQSYITFDEWVRRITARGQFNKYKPLIEAILDESKPIPAHLINEFVQVQKNFYYDQYYNEELGVIAPRQIKNAEFVLVPRFVKGTQLEQVAQLMEERGIDQLNTEETSKAGKCNVLTIFDENGNITDKTLEDFGQNIDGAKELYNYNYLYTQQETPQHMNAENKAGIQIMKKIIDNISPTSKLYPVKEKFFRLYCANIKDSFNTLMKELNVTVDDNGNIKLDENGDIQGLDYEVFFDRLQEEVARLGLDSNMMDYVTLTDANGGITAMPTYMSNVLNKLESIAQSMFNSRITRQTLPGFHAAQITPVGFRKKDGQISRSSELKYHPDDAYTDGTRWISKSHYERLSAEEKKNFKKGIAPYVEVMLPANNFGLKWDGSEEQQAELIKQLEDEGLDQMIGYRIPTEGKQSVCIMKVVGFTQDSQGSTIVVPDNWVSQTGSDFDIDSVYGINFKGKWNKETRRMEKVKYDAEKSESKNSRDARNNELLQCMLDILSDESSVEENLSRSNFDDVISARDKVISPEVQRRRKARSSYNFFDNAEMQEDVMSGAKLKAFSVTRDTFCSICNTVRPTISDTHAIRVVYMEKDGYSQKELEKAFGKKNVEVRGEGAKKYFVVKHNKLGWSGTNKNVRGKIITAYSSQTTAHILDAVKEGAIPNVNDLTFQVYKMFPDIGSDYETGVAFMMQPGVTRIVEAYNASKSIYSDERSKPVDAAIKSIGVQLIGKGAERMSTEQILKAIDKKYRKEIASLFGVTDEKFEVSMKLNHINSMLISGAHLNARIKETSLFDSSSPVGELRRTLYDLGVILQYHKLSQLASTISDYARVCNPDKFGAKQTLFATRKVFEDIQDFVMDAKEHPVLTTEKGDFLSAIYPDAQLGVDGYIQSQNMDSAYPPLNHFLKYATATSIKVSRKLFETQQERFVRAVEHLRVYFSGENKQLTEDIYKDFEHYILGTLYTRTDAVQKQIIYLPGQGWVYDAESNIENERRRIFGYGKEPNLKVTDKEGNVVDFEVADITRPTEDEIREFATLSPAQKVQWIQSTFSDAGVFSHLSVSLYNSTQYRKNKAGSQTIEFVENNADIESIYAQFEEAFFNTNPFVAMTAMDIVKYAFTVEGFRMRKNAVNKIIKNSVLMTGMAENGTGIVEQLNQLVRDVTSDGVLADGLYNDFIRSHSDIRQIESHTVKKVMKEVVYEDEMGNKKLIKQKVPELDTTSDGIIVIDGMSKLAAKYGFVYDQNERNKYPDFSANSYVKLKINVKTQLYKIVRSEGAYSTTVIAYPINTLEATETGEWSSNPANNTHLSEEYYQSIIDEWQTQEKEYYDGATETQSDLKGIIESKKGERDKYRAPKVERHNFAKTFDINKTHGNDAGGLNQAKTQIIDYFAEKPQTPLYIQNIALSHYISHPGAENGSIQTINGKKYLITKVNIGRKMKTSTNTSLNTILQRAQEAGYKANDVFKVEHYTESAPSTIMMSSITEATPVNLGVNSMRAIQRRQISEGDTDAMNAHRYLTDKGIIASAPSVRDNIADVIRTSAEYVQNTVEKLLEDLEHFIHDDDGTWYSVNDSRTIDLIRNNFEERKRFLKTLLDARAFVTNYGMINNMDIDSQDENIKANLRRIKDAINKLENATVINQAEERFANEYLSKLSDNPLIQNDIITLLDGYHSAAAFDAWVNDLQETSSPLLQIITKEVMGDIRAKEMKAQKHIQTVRAQIAEIKKRAQAAGLTVNYDNIIDEDGKFIQEYNKAFVEKIQELRDNIVRAKIDYGENSEEHLKAKFAYDKFKYEHTHQKLKDDYYRRKLILEETMLYGYTDPDTGIRRGPFLKSYIAYQKLLAQRREIYSHAVNGVLADEYREDLKKVNAELDNLTKDYVYDVTTGTFISKTEYANPTNPFTGTAKELYSLENATALQNFMSSMRELREEFFQDETKFGFDEELEKNLDIVSNYEARDRNGRPTVPLAELMKHEDYVKAKEWLEHNARFVVGEDIQEQINKAFRVLREGARGRKILATIAKQRDLYDSHGVIDATQLTEDEIARIRHEQLSNYNIREGQPYSDRSLISNAPSDTTVFKASFYTGMTITGARNQDYLAKVNEINQILAPYFETRTRTLHTSEMPTEVLDKLKRLYEELEEIKTTNDPANRRKVRNYIRNNVDFIYDEVKFQDQWTFAKQKGGDYERHWLECNATPEMDDTGNYVRNADGSIKYKPNRYIYGYAVPRGYKVDGTGNNSLVDRARTDAMETIRNYCTTTKTEYYYQKYQEMRAKSDDEFKAWYDANHIYNPYTHTVEPLQCWTRMEINPMADEGSWVPAFSQIESVPKDDALNDQYKEGSTASNYKGTPAYRNNDIHLNDYEREIKQLFQDILYQYAQTSKARRFFDAGNMAARSKGVEHDAKFYAKETAKLLGWIDVESGKDSWYDDIDYAKDRTINMPLTAQLKSKDSVQVNRVAPNRKDYAETPEGQREYDEAVNKYNEEKKKADEQNAEVHRKMLDRDWESVLEDYIAKAAHFNAVQDNKYMLFYAKKMLDKIDVYVKNEGFNDLQKDHVNSDEYTTNYVTKKDTRLREQYENWIRRLVYDQWKKPNGMVTRAANILQSLTSAKFMMLNITGGIANVTVGETQVIAEAFAKEYFGQAQWAAGLGVWHSNMVNFLRDMYSDKSSSVASAVCKFFNVVDFDENTGSVHIPDASTYIECARDLAFSPQAMGEHGMQNGALFSMLMSHRVIINHDKENNGRLSYKFVNEAEYMRDAHEQALQAIMTDEQRQQYQKFIDSQKADANKTKSYAWFRKDLTHQFAVNFLSEEQQKQFIEKRKEIQKQAKEEFNNDETHPTLWSQLELSKDGYLKFKDGSILAEMGDEAYDLLGRFKGRVISVNKKIHGVYDRLGAAKWESYWWGGLVMQYHKHLYPGIMKRWRRQGYFNEERGTIEKGCYWALKDFLSIPINKATFAKQLQAENGMSEAEIGAMQSVQNVLRNYVEFATHIKTHWQMLPEHERANMRRALGDLAGVMAAICLAIGLRVMAGDDDDDQDLIWNLAMYEADRLASESFMYNPLGIYSEGKKLWSSPIAATNGVEDLLSSAGFIAQWALGGEDFDPYYKTGLYVGEHKGWVMLRRNIPMYHAINMVERLNRSNKYYKLGENMLSIIPVKDIADWIND